MPVPQLTIAGPLLFKGYPGPSGEIITVDLSGGDLSGTKHNVVLRRANGNEVTSLSVSTPPFETLTLASHSAISPNFEDDDWTGMYFTYDVDSGPVLATSPSFDIVDVEVAVTNDFLADGTVTVGTTYAPNPSELQTERFTRLCMAEAGPGGIQVDVVQSTATDGDAVVDLSAASIPDEFLDYPVSVEVRLNGFTNFVGHPFHLRGISGGPVGFSPDLSNNNVLADSSFNVTVERVPAAVTSCRVRLVTTGPSGVEIASQLCTANQIEAQQLVFPPIAPLVAEANEFSDFVLELLIDDEVEAVSSPCFGVRFPTQTAVVELDRANYSRVNPVSVALTDLVLFDGFSHEVRLVTTQPGNPEDAQFLASAQLPSLEPNQQVDFPAGTLLGDLSGLHNGLVAVLVQEEFFLSVRLSGPSTVSEGALVSVSGECFTPGSAPIFIAVEDVPTDPTDVCGCELRVVDLDRDGQLDVVIVRDCTGAGAVFVEDISASLVPVDQHTHSLVGRMMVRVSPSGDLLQFGEDSLPFTVSHPRLRIDGPHRHFLIDDLLTMELDPFVCGLPPGSLCEIRVFGSNQTASAIQVHECSTVDGPEFADFDLSGAIYDGLQGLPLYAELWVQRPTDVSMSAWVPTTRSEDFFILRDLSDSTTATEVFAALGDLDVSGTSDLSDVSLNAIASALGAQLPFVTDVSGTLAGNFDDPALGAALDQILQELIEHNLAAGDVRDIAQDYHEAAVALAESLDGSGGIQSGFTAAELLEALIRNGLVPASVTDLSASTVQSWRDLFISMSEPGLTFIYPPPPLPPPRLDVDDSRAVANRDHGVTTQDLLDHLLATEQEFLTAYNELDPEAQAQFIAQAQILAPEEDIQALVDAQIAAAAEEASGIIPTWATITLIVLGAVLLVLSAVAIMQTFKSRA